MGAREGGAAGVARAGSGGRGRSVQSLIAWTKTTISTIPDDEHAELGQRRLVGEPDRSRGTASGKTTQPEPRCVIALASVVEPAGADVVEEVDRGLVARRSGPGSPETIDQ